MLSAAKVLLLQDHSSSTEKHCTYAEYLGSDQPNFTLNFSKSASMIIGQYYQFVRLGFEGYKKIMASLLNVAQRLQEGVEKLGELSIL